MQLAVRPEWKKFTSPIKKKNTVGLKIFYSVLFGRECPCQNEQFLKHSAILHLALSSPLPPD